MIYISAQKSKIQLHELSHWLIGIALVAVGLAGVGYLGQDIWLASTQWLLVAAVFVGLGIYTKLESK